MIQLKNVTKFYQTRTGPRYILKDVSLVIPDRANLAVLGPNGAGKSTFLRMIGGAEMPNSGKIVSDVLISWPLGISSGFQGSLTGRSNVLFVCKINGLSIKWCRRVVEEVKAFAELGEYFDMPVASYSSGMRARLSFGLSMAFAFDVYLIDELTSVGDANFRKKAVNAFEQLKERASLIYVSHSLSSLRQTCDCALFLRDGNATFYPDIEEGMAAYLKYCAAHRKLALEQNQSGKQAFAGIGMAGSAQSAQKKSARQPGSHAAKKAAKKAARKFAKKAAKKAARKRASKVAQNHAAEVHDPNPT
jgi:capsular polysaccharide transport system ATP-binding protein